MRKYFDRNIIFNRQMLKSKIKTSFTTLQYIYAIGNKINFLKSLKELLEYSREKFNAITAYLNIY
jgi:hypothetical protein